MLNIPQQLNADGTPVNPAAAAFGLGGMMPGAAGGADAMQQQMQQQMMMMQQMMAASGAGGMMAAPADAQQQQQQMQQMMQMQMGMSMGMPGGMDAMGAMAGESRLPATMRSGGQIADHHMICLRSRHGSGRGDAADVRRGPECPGEPSKQSHLGATSQIPLCSRMPTKAHLATSR